MKPQKCEPKPVLDILIAYLYLGFKLLNNDFYKCTYCLFFKYFINILWRHFVVCSAIQNVANIAIIALKVKIRVEATVVHSIMGSTELVAQLKKMQM